MITQAQVKDRFHYDPNTGVFTYRRTLRKNAMAGAVAGCLNKRGYLVMGLGGKLHIAHRLAWLYMTGEPPPPQMDHKNGERTDNRWSNLRAATQAINSQNLHRAKKHNRSGVLGAHMHQGKFKTSLCIDGRTHHIGVFDTANEAHVAYLAAKRKHHEGCTI